MGLNPGGTTSASTNSWNYHDPEKEGYALSLTGTVVAIQEVQAMNFGNDGKPTTPKFWENDGSPVWNIRMVLCGPSGGFRSWTFQPASKAAREGKKKSVHLDLFQLSGGVDMMDLMGKTITVETDAPPPGFRYGLGNPRPWRVSLSTEGPFALSEPLDPIFSVPRLLQDSSASGGAVTQPQQAQTTSQAQAIVAPTEPVMTPQPAVTPEVTVYDDIPF